MSISKFKISILTTLIIIPLLSCGGQKKPFSSLETCIQYSINIDNKIIHDYWHVKDGLNISYQTPFYYGEILAGFSFFPYDSKMKERPDFQSYFIYLGWLYEIPIGKSIVFSPGVKLGNYLMNFDIESEYDKFESEISTDVFVRLEYKITQKSQFQIEYGQQNVYIYKLLRLNFMKIGITMVLETPDWMLDIFK